MVSGPIFTDTSAWYAYIDKSDTEHAAAVKLVKKLDRPLITSNYIFDEDKGFSFTDCSSFAIMERLKISTSFVFDDHFIQYGKFVVIPT